MGLLGRGLGALLVPEDPKYLFVTKDWQGKTVRMTRSNLEAHRLKRPMMADYVEEAKTTIADPDIVHDADYGAQRLSRLGLGRGSFSNTWLSVVIYYNTDPATVATYMFARELPGAQIVKVRAMWVDGKRHLQGGA